MVQKVGKIWMNGKMVAWEDATVHVLTHTLHYGLGVFEGIRCYKCADGRSAVFRLTEHIDRLFGSAHICQIEIPFSKETLTEATLEILRINNLDEAYIRPLVYIQDGDMGIYVNNPIGVSISAYPWGAYLGADGLEKGINIKISSFNRFHVNNTMTKSKTCGHYVNSILAKKEAKNCGYDEALMLDTEGYISEGSGENIFMVRRGVIKTTPLTSALDGITRDTVKTIAKDLGYQVEETRFTRDELYLADEAFFTGTAAEVTPIRSVDNREIGCGKPGPVTQKIQETYFNAVKGHQEGYLDWLSYL